MMKLTREQRVALKRVYDRGSLYAFDEEASMTPRYRGHKPLTYRQFRNRVKSGYDCIMVKWCGMWLGIERDGYTHS